MQTAEKIENQLVRVIWIDDDLSDGGDVDGIFDPEIFDAQFCSDPITGLRMLQDEVFEYAVVDLLMPSMDGLQVVEKILQEVPNTVTLIYSGFVASHEIGNLEFFTENSVEYIDKNTYTKAQMAAYVKQHHSETLERIEPVSPQHLKLVESWSILDIQFDDFMGMKKNSQVLLVRQAKNSLLDEIEQEFSKGNVWFLYQGPTRPPITVDNYGDIPEFDEIMKICKRANVPIFQYYSTVAIDDLGWVDTCHKSTQNYPLLGLKSLRGESTRAAHFDTGASISFIDRTVVTNDSIVEISDNEIPIDFPLISGDLPSYVKTCSFLLMDPGGTSPVVSFKCVIPVNWNEFPQSKRFCPESCLNNDRQIQAPKGYLPQENVGQNGSDAPRCRYRWALIGRNVLLEAKLKFILDGEAKVMALYESD